MNKQKVLGIVSPLVSIALAMLSGSILIMLIGQNPLSAFQLIFRGAFGNAANMATTMSKVTTLTLTGLSYAFAYRCGMINIGAEGQLYMGALCSTLCVLKLPGPPVLVMIVAVIAGFIGGGLAGLLIGVLKVYFGEGMILNKQTVVTVFRYTERSELAVDENGNSSGCG